MGSPLRRSTLGYCLVITAIAMGASVLAQEPEVRVGRDIAVGQARESIMLIEPHLAAHPTDPRRLVGVAHATNPDYTEQQCHVFTTGDGGESWTTRVLEGARGCLDAWVTVTEDRALLTALGDHSALADDGMQLVAYFSPDDGSNWAPVPQSLGRYHDGPRSTPAADGTIYVTAGESWRAASGRHRAGVFVGRARRQSPHVETRERILPSNLNQVADGAAVLADGTLIVTYSDYQRPVGGPDGAFRGRAGALETRRVWAISSTDGGESFSVPMLVTESCWARPTFLAVDRTERASRDRLYHVCIGEDSRSILLTSSASGGEEWTDAQPVEAPATQSGSRMFPQVAVNRDGIVAVAWMDRRDDASGDCYAPYLVVSADGGETFSAPVRIASELSCPELERAGRAGGRFPMGGDYFGLAGAADGRFHVLWPDARNGTFALRTASVSLTGRATR